MYLYAFHYRFRHSGMGTIEDHKCDYDEWDGIAEVPAASFEGDRLVHEFYDDDSSLRVELERDSEDPSAWHADVAQLIEGSQTGESHTLWSNQVQLREGRLADVGGQPFCDAMESWYLMVTDRSDGVRVASKNHHWLRAGKGLWKPKFPD